ncbi:MAG: leucyl aminopeptidase [Chloroflexota bacterium]|nr:leucyl aminopeptidase [Chloroflexota bacterium]MDP6757233.1 leucyl aminopeptidase [Chloroflexota bacterium]
MDIHVIAGDCPRFAADTLIIGLFEDAADNPALAALDSALGGEIARLRNLNDFTGEFNALLTLYPGDAIPAGRVVVVGLGKAEAMNPARATEAMATAVKQADGLGAKQVATAAPAPAGGREVMVTEAMVVGSKLALYRYDRFKTFGEMVDKQVNIKALTVVVAEGDAVEPIAAAAAAGAAIADAVTLARDLQNAPGGHLPPEALSDQALAMCAKAGVEARSLGLDAMAELKMGALLGVAQGSAEEPRLIVMDYVPEGESGGTVAICGKGVTFDTGGISLKPGLKMGDMKFDMSGAAATIGIIQAAAALELPLRVVGIVAAVENMPDGRAVKPGDVLTAMNGKTIEVDNTDAEGRLVLADALCYAREFAPDAIVDMATLTGAVIIALGHHASGMMGTNAELNRRVSAAGEFTGERVWELPLWEEYEAGIKGKTADINNTGGRPAGTINGGMFLKHFAGDVPWCHLDIAGTAWDVTEKAHIGPGGTGVGVRLITQLLREWAGPPQSG